MLILKTNNNNKRIQINEQVDDDYTSTQKFHDDLRVVRHFTLPNTEQLM